MRLRNIPGSREAIAESSYVIPEKDMRSYRGRWHEVFGNANPIDLEIGMGKGQFLMELSEKNPFRNYIGVEKYSSVLIRAIEKRSAREDLTNLYFLRMEAEYLPEVFGPEEISRIYLNFSDPWPKDRHAHRRLPGRVFLARYEQFLCADGQIEFKTDNQDLFSFALEEAREAGWNIYAATRDLHHDPELAVGNIMTEYEAKFSSLGNPICKMIIGKQQNSNQKGTVS